MLSTRYKKLTAPNAGHAYSVHSSHGRSAGKPNWLLCRDSDGMDRVMVPEFDLENPGLWMRLD